MHNLSSFVHHDSLLIVVEKYEITRDIGHIRAKVTTNTHEPVCFPRRIEIRLEIFTSLHHKHFNAIILELSIFYKRTVEPHFSHPSASYNLTFFVKSLTHLLEYRPPYHKACAHVANLVPHLYHRDLKRALVIWVMYTNIIIQWIDPTFSNTTTIPKTPFASVLSRPTPPSL